MRDKQSAYARSQFTALLRTIVIQLNFDRINYLSWLSCCYFESLWKNIRGRLLYHVSAPVTC